MNLSYTSQYSDFRDWLDQAINEGCIQKHENKYKFVHDKVREAAYNLIANGNKSRVGFCVEFLVLMLSYDIVFTPMLIYFCSSITI